MAGYNAQSVARALVDALDYAAVVGVAIHDGALGRLKVVVGLGLHARLLHEREEDIEADLELAVACLAQPGVVSVQDAQGLLADLIRLVRVQLLRQQALTVRFVNDLALRPLAPFGARQLLNGEELRCGLLDG